MAHSHALLRAQTSNSARPAMQILQAGDHQVLMQYGANEMDIKLNFRAQALQQALSGEPVAGIRETAVGFRSVLITFDPSSISRTSLLDELVEREESVPNLDSLVLQSRTVTMPIAFDDAMTRAAVERYRISVRSDAPNVRDGDNIDYIVHCNGLLSREDFYDTFTEATWWTAFIGYFPGLPFLYSLDPCTQLSAPKYNPARMWTAEGCLALGGPCVAIYPMSVPGSYQLFGRTLPVWNRVFSADPADDVPAPAAARSNVLRTADRVNFSRVSEPELLAMRLEVFEGTYSYPAAHDNFVVSEYLKGIAPLTSVAESIAGKRHIAACRAEIP